MILENLLAAIKETQFVTERESPYTCKIFITTFFLFSDIKIYSFYDMSSETNGSIIGVTGNVSSLDDHKPITFIFFRLKIVAIIFILFTQEHHCQQQASCNYLNRH